MKAEAAAEAGPLAAQKLRIPLRKLRQALAPAGSLLPHLQSTAPGLDYPRRSAPMPPTPLLKPEAAPAAPVEAEDPVAGVLQQLPE